MARKIIWTGNAEKIFVKILEFYYNRNGSKSYSKKLSAEIKQLVSFLKRHPFLGMKAETKNTRVLVKGNYKIFYRIAPRKS